MNSAAGNLRANELTSDEGPTTIRDTVLWGYMYRTSTFLHSSAQQIRHGSMPCPRSPPRVSTGAIFFCESLDTPRWCGLYVAGRYVTPQRHETRMRRPLHRSELGRAAHALPPLSPLLRRGGLVFIFFLLDSDPSPRRVATCLLCSDMLLCARTFANSTASPI